MTTVSRLAVLAMLAAAAPAGAQLYEGIRVQAGPQVVRYTLAAPISETVTEFALPLFAVMTINDRLSVDVGTAFAQSRVRFAGGESTVSGLTDTQLRANYTLGNDFVVLTAGLNLPTGESTVSSTQLLAASRIANDFLSFPISSMGSGAAVTAGAAIARPFGEWSIGAGGSVRLASAFEPVRPDSGPLPRYQPGNEYKLRVGADRPVGAGQVAVGFTFSTFGRDEFGGSLYNTGNRFVGQVGFSRPMPVGTLNVGAWNLYRSAGQLVGGVDIPWDNILNASTSLAVQTRNGATLEPSIQIRSWLQRVSGDEGAPTRTNRSALAEVGVRARLTVGPVAMFPGLGYTVGRLAAGSEGHAGLTGFRGMLGVQLR